MFSCGLFYTMKYLPFAGIACCVVIIISCFLPWAYYPDLQKSFTGFFSENQIYGKPGKYLIFFAVCCILGYMFKNKLLQAVRFFMSGLLAAYAVKTYILFTSCYGAYCPDKKPAIIIMLVLSIVNLILASVMAMVRRQEVKNS